MKHEEKTMNEKQIKLVIGSLLHDLGKLFDNGSDKEHGKRGYEKLCGIEQFNSENDILDCVKYHHRAMIEQGNPSNSSPCYITHIANRIAADVNRRSKDSGDTVSNIELESVFNILNGNSAKCVYNPKTISDSSVNFPTKDSISGSDDFYKKAIGNLADTLNSMSISREYINSLLQTLRSDFSYIPSSTDNETPRDISFYDHAKLTAALALCVEHYLEEKKISDYKAELFDNSDEFYGKKAFRLYSLDMSGIQDFIYNISSKSALKGLRARSFYLEILLEDIVDELLDRLGLCRANVLYTGGGHTYIITPATEAAKKCIEDFENGLRDWFVDTFGTALFVASGYTDCSANELKNTPAGSYKDIFRRVSTMLSKKKLKRYSADDLKKLNKLSDRFDGSRECIICHRGDMLDENNECTICSGLKKLSNSIIEGGDNFFAVVKNNTLPYSVPLPFDHSLVSYPKEKLVNGNYIRAYSKNKALDSCSQLFVGDYTAEQIFEALVKKSRGIKRLAVIRADVDNLGQAFVNGFSQTECGKYETISRTSAFSAKLSEFFKLNINSILAHGEFSLFDDREKDFPRNAVIVYSGGDDLFVVGGWDDIIGFAVDLHRALKKFSLGTLTISAGIGIFPEKYPIYSMAEQTGELEDVSKKYNNSSKNAVTLFDKSFTHSWDELIDDVIGKKLHSLKEYIDNNGEHGKAMLYKMLELIRNRDKENRLNVARFAYLLARLKPDKEKCTTDQMEGYNKFAENMYRWIQNGEESRRLVTAIYIYIYMNREREEKTDENT